MAHKFYKGANAGYIGNTENGLPIRDYFIVKMVNDDGRARFFQLQKRFGVEICGEWIEITPVTKMTRANEDGDWYPRVAWKLNSGKEIAFEELELRYTVIEITSVMQEIARLYFTGNFMSSPYIKMKDCVEICYSIDELDRKNKADKFIIDSVEKYIKERKAQKKYDKEMLDKIEKNMPKEVLKEKN